MENTKIEWCDHTFNPWIGCRNAPIHLVVREFPR